MAAVVTTDWSISATGDIRYSGTGTNNTVIELHRWLGDLMDDAQASGNDILDITDATASERSTDNIITLKYPYNIDWVAAQHLYDGSIIQSSTSGNLGEIIYDGILVFAPANTPLQIIQNGYPVVPNFWTTGINADAANGISHRFMLKVRDAGTDIDNRALIGQTRNFLFTYSEFKINSTSRGNNVMALQYASDLNNTTSAATVKAWTTVTNTEGYRGITIGGVVYYFDSEWDKAAYSINQFYERIKWLTKTSTIEDYNSVDSGTDYIVGNGTLTGQGQSFANGVVAGWVTRAQFMLKKFGSPTGTVTAKVYSHTGTWGSGGTPNTLVATSETIDVSKFTTSYLAYEFEFKTQSAATLLAASTNYFITVEYSGGDASNYIQVQGKAAGTHAGNEANKTGSWTAVAGADLWFAVYTCPSMYGVAAERVRGITHEVAMTTPRSGSFSATELVSWSTGTGIMFAIDSVASSTKMWIQLLTGTAPTTQLITGATSSATGTANGTTVRTTLSYPMCGASTGSAIIGAWGFGIKSSCLTSTDKVFDLDNTVRIPPNNVTFTVGGLISSEDRVLVGPASGAVLDESQFTIDATYSGATVTSIQVSPAIPTDTPTSGTIRVKCNSGIWKRIAYTSYTGDVFTVTSTDFSTDNATSGNQCFISYIDTLAGAATATFTGVYLSDRSLFIRVRDGGTTPIKTFETTGTLGSAGGSATAIRTPDV